MFKLFGIALFRAHSYGVLHAVGFIVIVLLFILFVYRRYHRLVQKDRAAKAVQRTNVFVVVDSSDSTTFMKDLENESDEDDDDVDYAKLLRELDTPNNLLKEKINNKNKNNNENDDDDDGNANKINSAAAATSLPPASTTRARPFSLRLMDAIESTAVTQLAELIRLHSSMHRQQNRDAKQFMDQTAVFDIPENIARNRAVSLLEGALRQRRREAAISLMTMTTATKKNRNQNQQSSQSGLQEKFDIDDEIYHSLFDNHCTSAIPSPASILSTNRRNLHLVGTTKANAPFMRQREAYYCACIDAALGVEDSTLNFATHFAYGTDVGRSLSGARVLGNFFLGEHRFAKSNLRGGHVVTAGGLIATMPDPLVCRQDLILLDQQTRRGASGSSTSSSSTSTQQAKISDKKSSKDGNGQHFDEDDDEDDDAEDSGENENDQLLQKEEKILAMSSFKDLSDDWAKGTSWSLAEGDGLNLLRRYDDLVVLCVRSAQSKTKNNNSSNAKNKNDNNISWNLPSCVPLFSSVHQHGTRKQPRVVACTTPHSIKYLLPEYSSPRDSIVSSARRYRYHLENVRAVKKALEKHAEDIAIEGFAVGQRVAFKRSLVNKVKEGITDAFFAIGRTLKIIPSGVTSSRNVSSFYDDGDQQEMRNRNKEKHA